jgi:arylformamidase
MKIIDISTPLNAELITWPGSNGVVVENQQSIKDGSSCNTSLIHIGSHDGTHVDAPKHFIDDGNSVDCIPLESMIGDCIVIEVSSELLIKVEDIVEYNLSKYKRILFKTRSSKPSTEAGFNKDFVSLSLEAALYLLKFEVLLIGIDCLSIESFYSRGHDVHKALLSKNIVILEGLDLSKVEPGEYCLISLPLKLIGCDGAPVRAILKSKCIE